MLSQFLRKKKIDVEHLLHSEWNRRLGLFSLCGISGIFMLTTAYFIVLPNLLALRLHSIPFIPYLYAVVLLVLAAFQWSTISRLVPRNGVLFNFAYATHSELLAFCLMWSQLLDFLLYLVYVTHTLSEYMNLLFRGAVKAFLHVSYQVDVLSIEHFDFFGLFSILLAASILCCSLRVLVTVVLVFLITLFFTLTSTTIVALMQNFTQLRFLQFGLTDHYEPFFHSVEWLMLLVLCLESLGFLAEESEQPQKFLPWTFQRAWKFSGIVMALAIIAFYPFDKLIHFHSKYLLPNVFGQVGIYSARYFMNVGAVCGLCGTLLVAFLPPTRILYTLAHENLLPGFHAFRKLHGKGGAPRNSVVLVTIIASVISVLPKDVLLECVPLNVSLRLFCQSLLLYKECFSSEKLEFHDAKYNRLRKDLTIVEGLSNYSFDYSPIPSDGEEEEDTDAEILRRMREVNQVSDESEIKFCQSSPQTKYDAIAMEVLTNPDFPANTTTQGCIKKLYKDPRFFSFQCTRCLIQSKVPWMTMETSPRLQMPELMNVFSSPVRMRGLLMIVEFVPILSIVGIVGGLLMSCTTFLLVGRIKLENRNRWQPLGCLITIFLLTIILFHFSLLKYGVVFGWIMIGTTFYILNIICNK